MTTRLPIASGPGAEHRTGTRCLRLPRRRSVPGHRRGKSCAPARRRLCDRGPRRRRQDPPPRLQLRAGAARAGSVASSSPVSNISWQWRSSRFSIRLRSSPAPEGHTAMTERDNRRRPRIPSTTGRTGEREQAAAHEQQRDRRRLPAGPRTAHGNGRQREKPGFQLPRFWCERLFHCLEYIVGSRETCTALLASVCKVPVSSTPHDIDSLHRSHAHEDQRKDAKTQSRKKTISVRLPSVALIRFLRSDHLQPVHVGSATSMKNFAPLRLRALALSSCVAEAANASDWRRVGY